MGVSKNPFPQSMTPEKDFLDTHLISTIFLATEHSYAIIMDRVTDTYKILLKTQSFFMHLFVVFSNIYMRFVHKELILILLTIIM